MEILISFYDKGHRHRSSTVMTRATAASICSRSRNAPSPTKAHSSPSSSPTPLPTLLHRRTRASSAPSAFPLRYRPFRLRPVSFRPNQVCPPSSSSHASYIHGRLCGRPDSPPAARRPLSAPLFWGAARCGSTVKFARIIRVWIKVESTTRCPQLGCSYTGKKVSLGNNRLQRGMREEVSAVVEA